MGIESGAGLEFGHSRQTTAEIKSRNPGLFGKLPPSLQRAGKDCIFTRKNSTEPNRKNI